MGVGKRKLTMAAVAVVCAITVLGAPVNAYASQSKPTEPTPGPSAPASPSASPSPSPPVSTPVTNEELEVVRAKLEGLYHDAAVATDAYNAAEEKADQQSEELVDLAHEVVKGQQKLDKLQDLIGAAARAQYRGGGLPPEVQLWLSENPQDFLEGADRVRQGQLASKGLLAEMTRTQQDLEQYSKDASARWEKLETNRKAKEKAKKKIKKQIAAAEELEAQLEDDERERLAQLEEDAAQQSQAAWLDSGILDEINGKASPQGKKAVKFATDQIGKWYEWGAEGPDTYDCSGLTSQAWAAAGLTVPRTSQEQWRRLKHIDIQDMRPGDLIIYNADASHVAMYLGNGSMVHAPRPNRKVTIAGAGTMQILGVVRPDA
ncbi:MULTISPECIES: C40 family peptidase [Streptomyces]|uniref:C40 family peptidase n=1 Tax=Streptomyces griseiscabiei TaxID=2993540 RepID=A0ABU4LIG6_9ACTN|nr:MULTISPECIES: C40 family peptidase [Streptomyces]MBZ3907886.1 C40 family peptidase [Streptomyces griseiscabiei]MDX2915256.1 C40 family peptidase [Streptomyces griseiscabiei]